MKLEKMLMTEDELDRAIVTEAEEEAEAQLNIIRALKPLKRDSRGRVMAAVSHLLEAEALVPGILAAFDKKMLR